MKNFIKTTLVFLIIIASSCSNEDKTILVTNETEVEIEELIINVDDNINRFIWQGLNLYYLWQEEMPDLADNRFSGFPDLYTYFREFDTPENTFDNLLFQKDVIDRFSWIVDDYIALENSFVGINTSNGMEFQLYQYGNGSTNVFGVVRYAIPNSSAFTSGVERGMIFNEVDGILLDTANYRDLLFGSSTSNTFGFASYNSGNPIGNGTSIELVKSLIQENPIAVKKVFTEGSKKIGYLMYNQFNSSFDSELNTTFGNFKSDGVNELILDLRYNGGGSVRTATYLGSMITGQFTGELYSKEQWNAKVDNSFDEENFINNFRDKIQNSDTSGSIVVDETINSLNLTKVYIIVSEDTASASELVINSLSAYIDVTLIGTTTVGKQVGSITLYDSDNLFKSGDNLSTEHTYAMQPLVLEIVNKNGKNEINGYTPGNQLPGILLAEEQDNLGVLGEKSDPLLNAAINLMTTGAKHIYKENSKNAMKSIYNSSIAKPAKDNMYVELKGLEK